MTISAVEMDDQAPASAWCDDSNLHVKLADGREIVTPLWWYPSLFRRPLRSQVKRTPGKKSSA